MREIAKTLKTESTNLPSRGGHVINRRRGVGMDIDRQVESCCCPHPALQQQLGGLFQSNSIVRAPRLYAIRVEAPISSTEKHIPKKKMADDATSARVGLQRSPRASPAIIVSTCYTRAPRAFAPGSVPLYDPAEVLR